MLCDDILEMIGGYHILYLHKAKMASALNEIENRSVNSSFLHACVADQKPYGLENVWVYGEAEEDLALVTLILGGWMDFSDLNGSIFDYYSYTGMRSLYQQPPNLIKCGTYYQHLVYANSHGEDFLGSVLEVVYDTS
jgi:hypothetical protein